MDLQSDGIVTAISMTRTEPQSAGDSWVIGAIILIRSFFFCCLLGKSSGKIAVCSGSASIENCIVMFCRYSSSIITELHHLLLCSVWSCVHKPCLALSGRQAFKDPSFCLNWLLGACITYDLSVEGATALTILELSQEIYLSPPWLTFYLCRIYYLLVIVQSLSCFF